MLYSWANPKHNERDFWHILINLLHCNYLLVLKNISNPDQRTRKFAVAKSMGGEARAAGSDLRPAVRAAL
jgi:hypothetical protein